MAEESVYRVDVQHHAFGDDGSIPNSRLPLLIYPRAVRTDGPDPAATFEHVFARNHWGGLWRNGIFPFPHYHSNAHEVLGIAAGRARVRLGGAAGLVATVNPGDVLVIPAGVGHQNLGSSGLLVVGGYPPGQEDYDLCRGTPNERPRARRNVEAVAQPASDPLYGSRGPLLEIWGGT